MLLYLHVEKKWAYLTLTAELMACRGDEASQNLHSSNANFDFQNSSNVNANANSNIYFISGKLECSALVYVN